MIRTLLLLTFVSPLLLGAQTPRFRYTLNDSGLPAESRHTVDSLNRISDRANGCPPRADTLWTADPRAPIPEYWLEASTRLGCRMTGLPTPVRRRLRDDSLSLPYYEHIARRGSGATEIQRSTAVRNLAWSGDPRYFPLLLEIATTEEPGLTPEGDYDASFHATEALAPYLATSRDARRAVHRAAENRVSKWVRNAGLHALTTANNDWSRRLLRTLSLDDVDQYERDQIKRALAHAPCTSDLVFVEWFGIEGQDYSKCELPPDFR